jgi:hypothetical protein
LAWAEQQDAPPQQSQPVVRVADRSSQVQTEQSQADPQQAQETSALGFEFAGSLPALKPLNIDKASAATIPISSRRIIFNLLGLPFERLFPSQQPAFADSSRSLDGRGGGGRPGLPPILARTVVLIPGAENPGSNRDGRSTPRPNWSGDKAERDRNGSIDARG